MSRVACTTIVHSPPAGAPGACRSHLQRTQQAWHSPGDARAVAWTVQGPRHGSWHLRAFARACGMVTAPPPVPNIVAWLHGLLGARGRRGLHLEVPGMVQHVHERHQHADLQRQPRHARWGWAEGHAAAGGGGQAGPRSARRVVQRYTAERTATPPSFAGVPKVLEWTTCGPRQAAGCACAAAARHTTASTQETTQYRNTGVQQRRLPAHSPPAPTPSLLLSRWPRPGAAQQMRLARWRGLAPSAWARTALHGGPRPAAGVKALLLG